MEKNPKQTAQVEDGLITKAEEAKIRIAVLESVANRLIEFRSVEYFSDILQRELVNHRSNATEYTGEYYDAEARHQFGITSPIEVDAIQQVDWVLEEAQSYSEVREAQWNRGDVWLDKTLIEIQEKIEKLETDLKSDEQMSSNEWLEIRNRVDRYPKATLHYEIKLDNYQAVEVEGYINPLNIEKRNEVHVEMLEWGIDYLEKLQQQPLAWKGNGDFPDVQGANDWWLGRARQGIRSHEERLVCLGEAAGIYYLESQVKNADPLIDSKIVWSDQELANWEIELLISGQGGNNARNRRWWPKTAPTAWKNLTEVEKKVIAAKAAMLKWIDNAVGSSGSHPDAARWNHIELFQHSIDTLQRKIYEIKR
jgi:hypothetical protein